MHVSSRQRVAATINTWPTPARADHVVYLGDYIPVEVRNRKKPMPITAFDHPGTTDYHYNGGCDPLSVPYITEIVSE